MTPDKKAERQAQFQRIDDYLQKLYARSKWKFNLLGIGLSAITFAVLWIIGTILQFLYHTIFRH